MKKLRTEQPALSAEGIQCPYCDEPFAIAPPEEAEALTEPIIALPYARDVEIFDPNPNLRSNMNGTWTTIGKEFFWRTEL